MLFGLTFTKSLLKILFLVYLYCSIKYDNYIKRLLQLLNDNAHDFDFVKTINYENYIHRFHFSPFTLTSFSSCFPCDESKAFKARHWLLLVPFLITVLWAVMCFWEFSNRFNFSFNKLTSRKQYKAMFIVDKKQELRTAPINLWEGPMSWISESLSPIIFGKLRIH